MARFATKQPPRETGREAIHPRAARAVAGAVACILALGLELRASPDASAEARSEAGLHRAFFHLPQGTIRVNYPDDMAAGDTISGTIYAEPLGGNQLEQDQNGVALSGYIIEMPGQKARASDGHFRWSVPARMASGTVDILLRDRSDHIVAQCSLPVGRIPLPPATGSIDLPLGAQAGNLVSAWGPFSPNSETVISVGGRDALLIAQSPRKVVFQTPPGIAGQTRLEIRNGGLSASGSFYSLALNATLTRKSMTTGATTVMTVVVSGLEGLKQPALLLIVSHEPGIVQVSGGPVQQIVISPADVQHGGTFQLTRTITGEHGGGYDLTVLVTLPPASLIPIERLAARVIDSWSRSSGVEVTPEARSLMLSGIAAAQPQLDTLFRAQLVYQIDPGTLLDWLVRDYCFNLRDQKVRAANGLTLFSPRPTFARAFTGGLVVAADSGAPVSLQASDVAHASFLQYLAAFLASHAPSRPLGSLLVTWQPDKQRITIDQNTGTDFFTARMFVVSVGDHVVKVANCQQHVTVSPNQQATMSCTTN